MNSTTRVILGSAVLALSACAATTPPSGAPSGYVTDTRGAVVKDPYNLCWRTGYWTPAMAILECDPDLVPKPAPAPAVAPPPPPPPPPAKPAAVAPKVLTITSTEFFDFDKATLRPDAAARIDKEVVSRLSEFATIQLILISGHTDRIGSQQFNQKLSERRAETVKKYLVSKGADASKIETLGLGKTVPAKFCPDSEYKTFKALVACLEPNRRAVVEIKGTPK